MKYFIQNFPFHASENTTLIGYEIRKLSEKAITPIKKEQVLCYGYKRSSKVKELHATDIVTIKEGMRFYAK